MNISLMTPNQKMLTPEEETALLEEWFTHRQEQTLVKILKAFSPLVFKFARTFALYGISRDELIAVGNLALVETAHKFDPALGFKFSTYALHWIRGMMLIFIASNYFSFSLKSSKMKKIFFSLRRVLYTEQQEGIADFDAIMDKMAENFGVNRTNLDEIYSMIRSPNTSFEQPLGTHKSLGGESINLGDTLAADEPNQEEMMIDNRLNQFHKDLIYSTMQEVLKERERTIITGQMLTEKDQEKTLQDLAEQFGLSRERIRQIRNTAFAKLETAIRDKCQNITTDTMF